MPFIHSKLSVFWLDTAGGVLTNISQYVTSVSIPAELEEVDVTSFGSTSRQFIAGFANGSVTISGHYDRTIHQMLAAIYAGFRAGTLTSVSFEYGPEGGDSGDVRRSGELVMTSFENGSEIEDPVSWTAEFRVSGAITDNTY